MTHVDWATIFMPSTPWLEIVVRGTIMYLSLFALLRFVLKREMGSMGITDLLVIVLIADAAQNGMAGQYRSLTDGLALVVTIVLWSYLLNLLAFHFPLWRRLIQPPRVLLVRDGRVLRRNLEHEKITEQELLAELHSHGCEDPRQVRKAWIEPDGVVTVIKNSREDADAGGRRRRAT